MSIPMTYACPITASFSSLAERGEGHTNHRGGAAIDKGHPATETSETPSTSRAEADAEVASSFASLLLDGSYRTSVRPPDVQVPPHSTVARWYAQLESAFKSEGFSAWADKQGLDMHALTLIPARGEIKGYVDGRPKTFICQTIQAGLMFPARSWPWAGYSPPNTVKRCDTQGAGRAACR